ncbi:MAG: hypothetical protein JJ850_02400 [Kordiimonadaceae bacterium]|nr:hypothetical protein [Kordiimonadaceae bacterium]MBO6567344.1 hypothetical protein [Kordiimonadaceae bacterium]MBO6963442.1 hypothetical protein [Kordiimonadaceae bacterium]
MTNYQSFDREGLIKAATISAADAGRLVSLYEEYFDLKVVETDVVSEELASSWGASAMAGQPCFVLASSSGTPVYLRIVQNPDMPNYTPLRTFGWNAIEICVADVDALYARLQSSPFKIIGPPAELEFSSIIYPMQAVGPEGEVLFLNEVRDNLPNFDLPKAGAWVDHVFIMVLAAPDRQKALEFYTQKLGWGAGDSYSLTYKVINQAFGFGEDHKTDLTMTCVDRLVNNEIDQYPDETTERNCAEGMLPPGIAAVTYIVSSLDAIDVPMITVPQVREGLIYEGRRTACCIGAAGELIELIEIG